MILRDTHFIVVNLLESLCMRYKVNDKPYYLSREIHSGHRKKEGKPIGISHLRRGKSFTDKYYPDVWAKLVANGKIDVYQVWHTESEETTIRDIVYSALTPNLNELYVFVTGENISSSRAENLINLILYQLHDENGHLLLDPRNVGLFDISELKDENEMEKFIRKSLFS